MTTARKKCLHLEAEFVGDYPIGIGVEAWYCPECSEFLLTEETK